MSALTEALDRLLNLYNDGVYDVDDNPGGFDIGGHRLNFIDLGRDVGTVGEELAADLEIIRNARQRQITSRNLYVSNAGNNSNPGTIGSPFQHIQHAIDYVAQSIDPAQVAVAIRLADGSYNENLTLHPVPGASNNGGCSIVGNTTTLDNVAINGSVFGIGSGNDWLIDGVKIANAGGAGIWGHAGAWIRVGRVNIAACVIQVQADHGGTVELQAATTFSGNCAYGCLTSSGGYILATAATTLTMSGTPAYSQRFCYAGQGSRQVWVGAARVGEATGQRYYADGGNIISGNGSETFFPGDLPGVKVNGGIYDGRYGAIVADDNFSFNVAAKTMQFNGSGGGAGVIPRSGGKGATAVAANGFLGITLGTGMNIISNLTDGGTAVIFYDAATATGSMIQTGTNFAFGSDPGAGSSKIYISGAGAVMNRYSGSRNISYRMDLTTGGTFV